MHVDYLHITYALLMLYFLATGGALVYLWKIRPLRDQIDRLLIDLADADQRAKRHEETIRKEAAVHAREEIQRFRAEADQEYRTQRSELQLIENRVTMKEETLTEKTARLEQRQLEVSDRERELDRMKQEATDLKARRFAELQNVSGMTEAEAKSALLRDVEERAKLESGRLVSQIEEEARNEGERRARSIISTSAQRIAAEHVAATTVSVVTLPSDDIKGRIIGREGRNVQIFETLTGVDVVIDDTPEAVVLSSFDPVRREIARLALTALVQDGRIHPTRIEEAVSEAKIQVETVMEEEAQRALVVAGITGLHPELLHMAGRMGFRTSYGQNLLDHSVEVCRIACGLAIELGADVEVVRRGAFLHDIGKIVSDAELPHALVSRAIMLRYGESPEAAHAAGAHHNDIPLESVEDVIVQLADTISASRPGARREAPENYVRRLEKLEMIADAFPGVEKTYAVQAGKEIRLIVRPDMVDDAGAQRLARDAAKRIEEEMQFPGQIKVTVIRETRATDYAK